MRRTGLMAVAVGLGVASACFPVRAQIYKCPDGERFSFQQSPCPGLGDSGGRLLVLPNGRPGPLPVPARSPTAVPVALAKGPAASASANVAANPDAGDLPKQGRVLGRTPLPSSVVARKAN